MQKLKEKARGKERNIVILYILIGIGAAIGIVSGIGSTCVVFDSRWWELPAFSIVEQTQIFFIFSYIVTWIVGIAWGVLYWALQRGKAWFYSVAVITSIAGIISGFIPCWILLLEDFQSYGETGMKFTPSWFRVIANIVLLIYLIFPSVRKGIAAFIAEKRASSSGSLGSDVSQMAFVVFGFGFVILAQPFIMPMVHPVWGDVYIFLGFDMEVLQFLIGISCFILGFIMSIAGKLINIAHSKTPVIRT